MFYSVGLTLEHYQNLRAMVERNIIPNTVLIAVDDISCFTDPESPGRKNDLLRNPFNYPPPPPPRII
jgi:hypothetical protein